MENRKYYCDCEEKCYGIRREVGKSTYYRHGPYRDPLSKYTLDMRNFLKNIPIIMHVSLSSTMQSLRTHVDGPSDENTDHTIGPLHKRARQSEDEIVGTSFWVYTG